MKNGLSSTGRRTTPPIWLLFTVSIAAAAAAIRLAWGARPEVPEVVRRTLAPEEIAALNPNFGTTLDAMAHPTAPARVGGRYRVHIEEPARKQADGVARIGGLVTFVAGARPGEIRTVEVTAMRGTVVEAVPLGPPEPSSSASDIRLAQASTPQPPVTVLHTAVVEGVGSHGDGRVTLDGIPVYIPGATAGERIVFEVVRRRERFATGRLVEKLPAADGSPEDASAAHSGSAPVATDRPLRVGDVHEVTITERAYRAPDREGVARIRGFPVIVPGAPTGETLRVRIVEVRERHARGERVADAP